MLNILCTCWHTAHLHKAFSKLHIGFNKILLLNSCHFIEGIMQAEDWANNKEYKGERVGENGVGRKRLLVRKNRITLDNAPCSGGGGMIYV